MRTNSQVVWYLDDDNIKHFTVIHDICELLFLKDRFAFVGKIETLAF